MTEGGQEAIRADEEVVPISRVRELENRVRELKRPLGRKTMETEILRKALGKALEQAHAGVDDSFGDLGPLHVCYQAAINVSPTTLSETETISCSSMALPWTGTERFGCCA